MSSPGYVTGIVSAEVYRVLRRAYKVDEPTVAGLFRNLLTAEEVVVEQAEAVGHALRQVANGADFADALIDRLGADAGCEYTVTFDQGAAKRTGMRPLV